VDSAVPGAVHPSGDSAGRGDAAVSADRHRGVDPDSADSADLRLSDHRHSDLHRGVDRALADLRHSDHRLSHHSRGVDPDSAVPRASVDRPALVLDSESTSAAMARARRPKKDPARRSLQLIKG
jgi:hypothetical protein